MSNNVLKRAGLADLLYEYKKRSDFEERLDLAGIGTADLLRAIRLQINALTSISGADSNINLGPKDAEISASRLEWVRRHLSNTALSPEAARQYQRDLEHDQACVAIFFDANALEPTDNGDYLLKTVPPTPLPAKIGAPAFFHKERSIAGSGCGFLASPTRFVTTMHSIAETSDLSRLRVLFDFTAERARKNPIRVTEGELHRFTDRVQHGTGGSDDWQVLAIAPVHGRTLRAVRRDGKVGDDDRIHMIGHPRGFPVKVAGHETVLDNTGEVEFTHRLDTFRGHSGAPVFNADTHEIEGIQSSGPDDITLTEDDFFFNRCIDQLCFEQRCVRATRFASFI